MHDRLFGRVSVSVAWVAMLGALIHPPHGLGLKVCWLMATTGVPCPGCGLSRALSCTVRGMFAEAWSYHPFGMAFVACFLTIAVVSVLPRSVRRGVAALIGRFSNGFHIAYAVFVASFVGFGVVRGLVHMLN